MRSTVRPYAEMEKIGRDAPGFFLYGLRQDSKESVENWKELREVAEIVRQTFTASNFPDHEFYYIGVPDVDAEKGEVATVHRLPGRKIKGGKAVFHSGDIIFARIEPSIYNKKTAIVPNIGACLASTEFLAARPKEGTNADYLLWVLRSDWIAQQVKGKMTGSTGRRRFERSNFAKLLIPWVAPDLQEEIAKVLQSARNKHRRLLEESEEALQEGEEIATEILMANGTTVSLLSEYDLEISSTENRWADIEKLYLPQKEDAQLKLEI